MILILDIIHNFFIRGRRFTHFLQRAKKLTTAQNLAGARKEVLSGIELSPIESFFERGKKVEKHINRLGPWGHTVFFLFLVEKEKKRKLYCGEFDLGWLETLQWRGEMMEGGRVMFSRECGCGTVDYGV